MISRHVQLPPCRTKTLCHRCRVLMETVQVRKAVGWGTTLLEIVRMGTWMTMKWSWIRCKLSNLRWNELKFWRTQRWGKCSRKRTAWRPGWTRRSSSVRRNNSTTGRPNLNRTLWNVPRLRSAERLKNSRLDLSPSIMLRIKGPRGRSSWLASRKPSIRRKGRMMLCRDSGPSKLKLLSRPMDRRCSSKKTLQNKKLPRVALNSSKSTWRGARSSSWSIRLSSSANCRKKKWDPLCLTSARMPLLTITHAFRRTCSNSFMRLRPTLKAKLCPFPSIITRRNLRRSSLLSRSKSFQNESVK